MNEFTKEQAYNVFESVFKEKPDEIKIDSLIGLFGMDVVSEGLTYLLMKGLRPVESGRRSNPYGLIFRVCKKGIEINQYK